MPTVSLGGAGSAAVGAWMLIERGAPPARIVERSAVLFLLTSAVNVLTLALTGFALFLGILPGSSDPLLSLLPGIVGAGAFAFFLALPRFADSASARRVPGKLQAVLETTALSIRDTRELLFRPDWRIIGAIAFLWADIGVLAACFAATGHTPPLSTIVLAYQIGYITNVIPVPGNIGILDGSLVGMFVLYGVNATTATAATVVYHGIALWIPATWGTITYIILRRTRHRPLTPRPPIAERRRLRSERRAERRAARQAERRRSTVRQVLRSRDRISRPSRMHVPDPSIEDLQRLAAEFRLHALGRRGRAVPAAGARDASRATRRSTSSPTIRRRRATAATPATRRRPRRTR